MYVKLIEARRTINQHLDLLNERRNKIQRLLDESQKTGKDSYDRVELKKELKAIDKVYEATSLEAHRINAMNIAIQNAEASKQNAEREAKKYKEMMKCLEIFRRIAKGDHVPMQDEQRLMGHDVSLYMMAKNMAMLAKEDDPKKHDSLWKDEVPEEPSPDPQDVANEKSVSIDLPQMPVRIVTEGSGEAL